MAENIKITIQNAHMDEDEDVRELRGSTTARKGRGFQKKSGIVGAAKGAAAQDDDSAMEVDHSGYDTYGEGAEGKYQRSIEGWIVFVTGVNEEVQEDAVMDKFAEYGNVQNLHLNLDRRTGFVKGYALVEYGTFAEAKAAVEALNDTEWYGQKIGCDFAFLKATTGHGAKKGKGGRGGRRQASQSPTRR